jgi:hypothetical protein
MYLIVSSNEAYSEDVDRREWTNVINRFVSG